MIVSTINLFFLNVFFLLVTIYITHCLCNTQGIYIGLTEKSFKVAGPLEKL